MNLAQESDVTIVTVGGKYGWGTSCSTGEGIDSSSINLPPCQERFLEKLGKAVIEFMLYILMVVHFLVTQLINTLQLLLKLGILVNLVVKLLWKPF